MTTRITNLESEKIGPQLWRLTRPLIFRLIPAKLIKDIKLFNNLIKELKVPANFITDGASCPKILWAFCSPMTGPQAEAAVLHDWLYSRDSGAICKRKQADKIFYNAMLDGGTSKLKARLIYHGVRIGGRGSWKKCKSKDKIKELK